MFQCSVSDIIVFIPGYGGKKGALEKCSNCKGKGVQVKVQQIGPGMIQQIQSMCPDCQGQGEKFNSKDRCKNCNGHKVERKKKILEVNIDKGMFWFFPLPSKTLTIYKKKKLKKM